MGYTGVPVIVPTTVPTLTYLVPTNPLTRSPLSTLECGVSEWAAWTDACYEGVGGRAVTCGEASRYRTRQVVTGEPACVHSVEFNNCTDLPDCDAPTPVPTGLPTIIQFLSQPSMYTAPAGCAPISIDGIYRHVVNAGLAVALSAGGPYTLAIPTDDAWSRFPIYGNLSYAEIREILLYHVVPGNLATANFRDAAEYVTLLDDGDARATLQSHRVQQAYSATRTYINQAMAQCEWTLADGRVHAIDSVLVPPKYRSICLLLSSSENPSLFDKFTTMLDVADLYTTLCDSARNFTVFVPSEAAFARQAEFVNSLALAHQRVALQHLLMYHIVPGDALMAADLMAAIEPMGVTALPTMAGVGFDLQVSREGPALYIDQATVIAADMLATNGVVHVVDTVLRPDGMRNLFQVLQADRERFGLFSDALQTVGLAPQLQTTQKLTVFAPVNSFFLTRLKPEVDRLVVTNQMQKAKDTLASFIVPDKTLTKSTLVSNSPLQTLSNMQMRVHHTEVFGQVFVGGLQVAAPFDISASNGIIHSLKGLYEPSTDLAGDAVKPAYAQHWLLLSSAWLVVVVAWNYAAV